LLSIDEVISATTKSRPVSNHDYAALESFRHALRHFLHFSAEAAHEAGLSPQQHQALLVIKGLGQSQPVTMGHLAERLFARHHSTVGLVNRLVRKKLLQRTPSADDRRKVHVSLTARGEALIVHLAAAHRQELRRLGPEIRRWLETLDEES
jgi:DNA-binding MarR family transcriptional regulator